MTAGLPRARLQAEAAGVQGQGVSAISYRVKALERHLGAELFQRSP